MFWLTTDLTNCSDIQTSALRWHLVQEFGGTERLRSTLRAFGWRTSDQSGSKKEYIPQRSGTNSFQKIHRTHALPFLPVPSLSFSSRRCPEPRRAPPPRAPPELSRRAHRVPLHWPPLLPLAPSRHLCPELADGVAFVAGHNDDGRPVVMWAPPELCPVCSTSVRRPVHHTTLSSASCASPHPASYATLCIGSCAVLCSAS
jgi:hypothetical protein